MSNCDLFETNLHKTDLFKIGEVAEMFHLSVGTLRHYEQLGLITPEYTDPKTGYRYYSVRQFERLTIIRYLRALDLPISQISDYLNNRDARTITEKLQLQKELLIQKQAELALIQRKIDHRLDQISDALDCEIDKIQLLSGPATRMILIRNSLTWDSHLSLEHSIRTLEKDQKTSLTFQGKVGIGISKEHLETSSFEYYDLVFLILDEEDAYNGQVLEEKEGSFVTIRYRGSHKESPSYYHKLLTYIKEHQLQITGFSREIALIDDSITENTDQFVTEIRIPVTTSS